MVSGKELGEMKHETTGEAIYCGKKLYGLRWNDTKIEKGIKCLVQKEKLAAKGITFCSADEKSPQKCTFTFDDLLAMYNGKEFHAFFSQPSTAKEVLKGKNPCQILRKNQWGQIIHNRNRTLRVT
jgi:hypothetical protein